MKEKIESLINVHLLNLINAIKTKYLIGDLFFISLILNEANLNLADDADDKSDIPAAAISVVNGKINLYINPQEIMKIVNNEDKLFAEFLELIIIHEILHIIYNHTERAKRKEDKVLYNVAGDYVINGNIIEYFSKNNKFARAIEIFKKIGLYETKYLKQLEEIVYDDLKQNQQNQQNQNNSNNNNNSDKSNNSKSNTSDNSNKSNKSDNSDNNGNNNNSQISYDDISNINKNIKKIPSLKNYDMSKLNDNIKKKIEEIVATVSQLNSSENKMKGSGNAIIESLLKYREYSNRKTLTEILKKSILNVLDKEMAYTWSKPRLSGLALGQMLPSDDSDELTYGSIVIALDESGSVSNDELEKAIPIIVNLIKYFKEVHIIKHDEKINFYKIYNKNNINTLEKDILVRRCCGGTSHKEVFEKINLIAKKNYNELSVAVIISDMLSDIDETKKILKKGIKTVLIDTNNLKII